MNKREIAGRTVIVTGAARGIGEATARLLAEEGARVVLGDLDEALVQQTAAAIGRGSVAARLDVTKPESWRAFLDETASAGPVDALVNNAGIMPLGSVLKEPDELARTIVDVNLHGVINGTKAVAPGMVERGRGHILNVASAVGRLAVPDGATYSASKFAVVGFTEATRAELAPHHVDVTMVLPTVVRTELAAGVPAARGVKAVGPEDVAKVILYALQKPKAELWVPRWVQGMTKTTAVLPRRVQEALGRAFQADRVLADRDESQRTAYEARVRAQAE